MRASVTQELQQILREYLSGATSLDEFLAWEAGFALDSDVPDEIRQLLDSLALYGEEVERGIRDEADFRELVTDTLTAAAPR